MKRTSGFVSLREASGAEGDTLIVTRSVDQMAVRTRVGARRRINFRGSTKTSSFQHFTKS